MRHNVANYTYYVNTMDQDVALGISGSVTQADLAPLRIAGRLGEYALVYRVERVHQGGGYGDQGKHPMAWAVAVYVDTQLNRVFNARNAGREWNNIDRLSSWLREQGFWCWWTRNDLEIVGTAQVEPEDSPEPSTIGEQPTANFPEPPVPL
jgi:hypothetical protein